MDQYQVTVRRIVREDITLEIMADSPEAARAEAAIKANDTFTLEWNIYDCQSWSGPDDVQLA